MTTEKTVIELDGVRVTIQDDGEGSPPWQEWTVYKYGVCVTADGERYATEAWGSRHDYENGVREPDDIGWMVLDELLSAAYDPDEFFTLATEGESGRERAKTVLALIETAEKMLPALERNQDAIEAHR